MTQTFRRRVEALAAGVILIGFIASFGHPVFATQTFTSPTEPIDDAVAVDSTAGSIVFVLSIVAVLSIAAFVVFKARRRRPW